VEIIKISFPFQSYVLQLIENLYTTVGFNVLENDEHATKLIRVTTLTWACNFEHESCLSSSSELFSTWMDNNDSVNR
jgi:aminopeptidase N